LINGWGLKESSTQEEISIMLSSSRFFLMSAHNTEDMQQSLLKEERTQCIKIQKDIPYLRSRNKNNRKKLAII
jgi:hypothetical protein